MVFKKTTQAGGELGIFWLLCIFSPKQISRQTHLQWVELRKVTIGPKSLILLAMVVVKWYGGKQSNGDQEVLASIFPTSKLFSRETKQPIKKILCHLTQEWM